MAPPYADTETEYQAVHAGLSLLLFTRAYRRPAVAAFTHQAKICHQAIWLASYGIARMRWGCSNSEIKRSHG